MHIKRKTKEQQLIERIIYHTDRRLGSKEARRGLFLDIASDCLELGYRSMGVIMLSAADWFERYRIKADKDAR
jgi:hypothetical protein